MNTEQPGASPALSDLLGLGPKRCGFCAARKEPLPETIGSDCSQWTARELERGWRFEETTNTKVYHCMYAFYGGS